ncbi:MAG: DUF4382 domain-containing protein [Armatimonadetes bacterium]|nr:DUF4382 domain-containing protein [Armatimonadota bacterium]
MKRPYLPLLTRIVLFVAFIATLIGCGGGGAGSSLSNSFNLFITDDASTNYSGVWVKLYKAELKGDGDTGVTLFESAEGLTVNLRQLNDGASKFLLLAPGQVPAGTYTKIQFEVDKTVNLVATGSGAPSTATFPDSLDNGAGHSNLALNLSPVVTMPGSTKVVVDFDLKNWDVVNGVITPVLRNHDGTGLEDSSRHERFEFNGVIGNLAGTAPNQTFDLTLRTGGTIKVSTDDTTDIVGEGDSAGLTSGRAASIFGAFDPATNTLKANIVHFISSNQEQQMAKAIGLASNVNADAGSFDLAPKYTKGFAPKGDTVSVTTDGTTVFRGKNGITLTKDQFFSALAAAGSHANVDLEGTYDDGSNTIAAKSAHVENEAEFGSAEAAGRTSNPNADTQTFDLAMTENEGMHDLTGTIQVQLSPDVAIKGPNGVVTTVDQFFSLLTEKARTVTVKGAFNQDTNVLVASRIEYKVDAAVNFTAKGTTSNPDSTGGAFDFLASQVSGLDLSKSTAVHLTVTANTVFRDENEQTISYDDFFALIDQKSKTLNIAGKASLPGPEFTITSITVMPDPVVLEVARGSSSNPNAEAGTFDIAVAESNGFDAPDTLHVQLGDGAALKGPQGISINRTQLYSYLNEMSRNVRVTGDYHDGTFVASKVELIFQ